MGSVKINSRRRAAGDRLRCWCCFENTSSSQIDISSLDIGFGYPLSHPPKLKKYQKIDATLSLYGFLKDVSQFASHFAGLWVMIFRDSIGRDGEEAPTSDVWDLWWRLTHQHPSTTGIELDYGWNNTEKWWMLLNIMLLYNRDILDLNQWKRNNME